MEEEKNIYMNHDQMVILQEMTLFFHALNHPLRQEILAVLDENKDSENSLTVTDIRNKIGQEQSVTSQQLAILLEPWLVIKTQNTHDRRYFY